MEKCFETEKHGLIIVRDVMVDINETDLVGGVEIELIDNDELLELVGYSVDHFVGNVGYLSDVIDQNI